MCIQNMCIQNQQTECHCVFLLRLKFLLLLRGSICELNSLCRDCHRDVSAIRDEIAAGDESQDESDVQPSSSSGSNTDWGYNGCMEQ